MDNDIQAQDVNNAETDTASESSNASQTISDTKQDDASNPESKYVPYERFKEVNDRVTEAEERYKQSLARLEELEKTVGGKGATPSADPETESLKQQLRDLGFITKDEQLAEVKRQKEDFEVQQELSRLEKEYSGTDGRPKFDRKSVVKYAIERGIGDLEIAYKTLNEAQLVDWHIKTAIEKSKGVKSEASDGSGSGVAGTSTTDLKEAAKKGDRNALKTLIGRIAKNINS